MAAAIFDIRRVTYAKYAVDKTSLGACGGGDIGLLQLLQHRVIQLAIAAHLALEDAVLDGLLGFGAGFPRQLRVRIGQHHRFPLRFLVFVFDAFEDVGALALESGRDGRELGLGARHFGVLRGVDGVELGDLTP